MSEEIEKIIDDKLDNIGRLVRVAYAIGSLIVVITVGGAVWVTRVDVTLTFMADQLTALNAALVEVPSNSAAIDELERWVSDLRERVTTLEQRRP